MLNIFCVFGACRVCSGEYKQVATGQDGPTESYGTQRVAVERENTLPSEDTSIRSENRISIVSLYYAYISVNSSRSGGHSLSTCNAMAACPFVYPLPTIMLTSFPTPSAPKAAFVKLVAMLKK